MIPPFSMPGSSSGAAFSAEAPIFTPEDPDTGIDFFRERTRRLRTRGSYGSSSDTAHTTAYNPEKPDSGECDSSAFCISHTVNIERRVFLRQQSDM